MDICEIDGWGTIQQLSGSPLTRTSRNQKRFLKIIWFLIIPLPKRSHKRKAAIIVVSFISSQQWSLVPPTSHGITKKTHQTYLKYSNGKCLYYYFYFIDDDLGLCYVRVPTWCPFRLQIYFNGHNWLAATLNQQNINFTLIDNVDNGPQNLDNVLTEMFH